MWVGEIIALCHFVLELIQTAIFWKAYEKQYHHCFDSICGFSYYQ